MDTKDQKLENSFPYPGFEITEEAKRKAAYALNMCTVSVSQIIDYRDLNILEQEYEAILNNLNLEEIPKNEALLQILKQLLDTITYFRIEAGDKVMIEKEYQQKVKNAIWSAVPNFGLIVAGGSPLTMAVSLASQVGIGYMNYRRNKAEYSLNREKQMWQLQRTAIEQFNGLRRELFDTAWRLADTYKFPDEYRLTERQIKQYNRILMDQDELRKFERLDAIKEKFSAYPPFWYFIGNAANYVAENKQIDISGETRLQFKKIALAHFEKYEELSKCNILREDQLAASCALEHVDLLLSVGTYDKTEILRLISKAVKMSGNAFDIMQLCAIAYLKVGAGDEAVKLLRILVNEDYNRIINAQLLSSIYVSRKNMAEYDILKTRVPVQYLYPMPLKDENSEEINGQFERQQKLVLKAKYKEVLKRIIDKYSSELYKDISVFDFERTYDEVFFENSKNSKRTRLAAVENLFADGDKKEYYLERLCNINLPMEYVGIFESMYGNIFANPFFSDPVLQGEVIDRTNTAIGVYRDVVNGIQEKIDSKTFSVREYEKLQRVGIYRFVKESFNLLYRQSCIRIEHTDMDRFFSLEGNLMALCDKLGIPEPELAIAGGEYDNNDQHITKQLFDVSIFGSRAVVAKSKADYINEMVSYVRDKMDKIAIGGDLRVYYRGKTEFERYFNDAIFEKYPTLKPNSIMVLKDKSEKSFDLIFTTEGIVYVLKNRVRNKTPYNDITYSQNRLGLFGEEYRNRSVDAGALFEIVRGIDKRFINDLEQRIEYIGGRVTAKILNEWFKSKPEAMGPGIVKVYAWPDAEILKHMGFCIEENLDRDMYLLQFYCSRDTGDIIRLRIVEFDSLDVGFREKLDKAGGIIKVEERQASRLG